MPHYKDGQEAKIGDFVSFVPAYDTPITPPKERIGRLVQVCEGAKTCDGGVLCADVMTEQEYRMIGGYGMPISSGGFAAQRWWTVTLGDCMLALRPGGATPESAPADPPPPAPESSPTT